MKKIKLLLVLLLPLLISCTKRNKLEDIFITPKNQYWQLSNTCQEGISCGEINYKFEEDKYSYRYEFSMKEGYILYGGADVIGLPEKWLLKNDSTLVWGNLTYKIEHIDKTVIVLSYVEPIDQKRKCYKRLLKVLGEK